MSRSLYLPKVSVVTPVLNGSRFIRKTVESVLSQQGDFELEYIIRDGGSTDDTLEILEEYENRCLIHSEPDGSPQDAINAGMRQATGAICCWLNADDIFEPGALQAAVTALSEHPDRAWCYGRCRIIDEHGSEIRRPITLYKNLLGFTYSRHILLVENYISQPATFWKRQLWEDIGGIQGNHKAAFDYELLMGMSSRSRAIPIHRYLARFRRHAGSISETHYKRQFQEELEIAARFGKRPHVWLHRLVMYKIIFIYGLLGRCRKWAQSRSRGRLDSSSCPRIHVQTFDDSPRGPTNKRRDR